MTQQRLTKTILQMRAVLRRHHELELLDHHLDQAEDRALPGPRRLHELGHLARVAHGADLALIAKGCGIADVGTVRDASEVAELVKAARIKKGPIFRLVKVMVEKLEFVMPPQDGAHLKDRFRQALLGHP